MKLFSLKALILLLVIFQGCSNKSTDQVTIEDLNWLEGTWKGEVNGRTYIETWQSLSGQNLYGTGLWIKGNDTVNSERIRLGSENEQLNYTVTLKNDSTPKVFTLQEYTDSEVTFVNEQNDFPRSIIYKLENSNRLIILLEGDNKSQTFNLEKQ